MTAAGNDPSRLRRVTIERERGGAWRLVRERDENGETLTGFADLPDAFRAVLLAYAPDGTRRTQPLPIVGHREYPCIHAHRRDIGAALRDKALAFLNDPDREDEEGDDHVRALVRMLREVRDEALDAAGVGRRR